MLETVISIELAAVIRKAAYVQKQLEELSTCTDKEEAELLREEIEHNLWVIRETVVDAWSMLANDDCDYDDE